jgi:HK97 family phage portal protein
MSLFGRAWSWLTESTDVDQIRRDEDAAIEWSAHGWMNLTRPDLLSGFPDPRMALGLPALNRALRIKTGLISTLPIRAELGDQQLEGVPSILDQPDPTEDRQLTIAKMVASITLRGEAIAVIGYGQEGFATAIKVIDPLAATLDDVTGLWTINGRRYGRDEILHVCPFLLPGATRATGAIELHRRALSAQIRAADFQDAFYRDAAIPSVSITMKKPGISIDEMNRYADFWEGELRGRRKAVVLDGETDLETLTLSHEDAQFVEMMQYSLAECALIIGVPPYFVGAAAQGMTYSNAHHERRNLLDIHLRDEIYAIERALSRLLPDNLKAKFDPTSFLRLDPVATVQSLAQQTWLTDDEKRAVMGYEPLTPEQRAQLRNQPAPAASTEEDEAA